MTDPKRSEREDGYTGDDAGDDAVSEVRGEETDFAGEEASACRGEGVGDEEAAGGADELSYSSQAVGAEDGEAGCAFGEVEHHGREAHDRTKEHADQDDGEGLEGERNEREGKWHGDVRTESDELG